MTVRSVENKKNLVCLCGLYLLRKFLAKLSIISIFHLQTNTQNLDTSFAVIEITKRFCVRKVLEVTNKIWLTLH